MEIIVVGIIVIFMLSYNKTISGKKFFRDNTVLFNVLKEDDYDFLVRSKYGDTADPNALFEKRLTNSILIFFVALIILLVNLTFLNVIFILVFTIFIFKLNYISLKSYYKKHLHEIDLLLPYYLKSLEILIQHYTVPVAIGKSVNSAPSIFKPGLKDLIAKINAGDSTIDPYMEFAQQYPVRDSMRMMRLLYRLGLGDQERKHDQLITFSKTISNLQAKARETKYKERLEKMEKKTMIMLTSTGIGVMIILIFAIVQLFNF